MAALDEILGLLPTLKELQNLGGGRYLALVGVYPFYDYVEDADEAVKVLTQLGLLAEVQSHASYLKPFYIDPAKLIGGGQSALWKHVLLTFMTQYGPVTHCTLSGSDPSEGDPRFAEVATGYGPQRLLVKAVVRVEDGPILFGAKTCWVTWHTGARKWYRCSAEDMKKALGR